MSVCISIWRCVSVIISRKLRFCFELLRSTAGNRNRPSRGSKRVAPFQPPMTQKQEEECDCKGADNDEPADGATDYRANVIITVGGRLIIINDIIANNIVICNDIVICLNGVVSSSAFFIITITVICPNGNIIISVSIVFLNGVFLFI